MTTWSRWLLAGSLVALVTAGTFCYFRYCYTDGKRLRVVEPGVLYRSGQLSADGFTDAILRYNIRTIVNAMDEWPDPDLEKNWLSAQTMKESELCRQLGVRYIHLSPDLISRQRVPTERPKAINQFLAIMDDPTNYPVLLHCRAGLHRTGCLVAVYRMEYQGFTPPEAVREMKAHGFGDFFCTSANDYVQQYVLTFQAGLRPPGYQFPDAVSHRPTPTPAGSHE
ncbi:MAG: dual specificity protein phosphatase family protein [Planctomycetia bacterium]|nr:dual specificity protein phosphatase family protein [Planctomycetia bacterium]